MQTKINVNWLFALTICLSISLPAFSAGASQRPDMVLRPCIDDQTFAVAHLNVAKLDLDAFVDKAQSLVSEHAGPDVAKRLQANLRDFRAQAGPELSGLPSGPRPGRN